LSNQEEAETEGETENDEDEEEPDNIDDDLNKNTNKWSNIVNNTKEVLSFPEDNHLGEDYVDSQILSSCLVMFVIVFKVPVSVSILNQIPVLANDNEVQDNGGDVNPGPNSLEEDHTHSSEYEIIDVGLNQYEEQVEHKTEYETRRLIFGNVISSYCLAICAGFDVVTDALVNHCVHNK